MAVFEFGLRGHKIELDRMLFGGCCRIRKEPGSGFKEQHSSTPGCKISPLSCVARHEISFFRCGMHDHFNRPEMRIHVSNEITVSELVNKYK